VVTFQPDRTFRLNGDGHHLDAPSAGAHRRRLVSCAFAKANVIHTGDVFAAYRYPFIDPESGRASVKGVLRAVDQMLPLMDDNTKVIPGHGGLVVQEGRARLPQDGLDGDLQDRADGEVGQDLAAGDRRETSGASSTRNGASSGSPRPSSRSSTTGSSRARNRKPAGGQAAAGEVACPPRARKKRTGSTSRVASLPSADFSTEHQLLFLSGNPGRDHHFAGRA